MIVILIECFECVRGKVRVRVGVEGGIGGGVKGNDSYRSLHIDFHDGDLDRVC